MRGHPSLEGPNSLKVLYGPSVRIVTSAHALRVALVGLIIVLTSCASTDSLSTPASTVTVSTTVSSTVTARVTSSVVALPQDCLKALRAADKILDILQRRTLAYVMQVEDPTGAETGPAVTDYMIGKARCGY